MQVPAPFEYERATSVDHAIGLLDRLGDTARLVAGGHSLLPMLKLRIADVEYVIDINDLHEDLGYIRVEPDEIRIGAMTRHRELLESPELLAAFPVFGDAERVIADPIVRNRGTLGGSLCQADPSEDLSAVCTTLDARCVIRGPGGAERVVTMEEFHRGPYETAVGANEMLVEVRLPVRPGGSSAYEKVERRAGDWAVVVVRSRGLARRRRHHRRAGGPGRRRPEHHRHPGDLRGAARPGALGGGVRRRRRDRRPQLLPRDRPARQRGLQTPPGRRTHPARATARRGPDRPDQPRSALTCR